MTKWFFVEETTRTETFNIIFEMIWLLELVPRNLVTNNRITAQTRSIRVQIYKTNPTVK
jgi:hypothetical protein